ncbi:TIGR03564 family F420-dependent LLM class oxidoreductase [Pseudonocardia humida]|uniref:TIGR03564 family F420-dependent LLM class oxidoreductase n=1 Tax=Pseudonocardia humida TaxID=2800819 RepID=A0ABT0ZW43_9PSEU|nr:TIGR03564 family F420-dependent LLM class oxidoreductase [Pseudonocardia humida]MCO1654951.1 TIGR03564 family F420-dependent LLM class oxidoreductase [Pseudonocardia humida]
MDIGVAVGDLRGPTTAAGLEEQVRDAATSGFRTAWASQALGWDALTALAVAGRVPGIALGTAVLPVPQRHPLVLAGQALSTQAAVDGRLVLGVGAGIGAMLGAMFGAPHDRPARRMREYLAVLRPLLRGEPVDHHGPALTAVGAVDVPGATPPPVLLAALGPAMLRVAGELADGTVTWLTGPRTLHEHVVPRLVRAAAGRAAPRVVVGLPVCVTTDDAAVRARIAERFAQAGRVPEYRAVLDREGVADAGGVAVVGDEDAVLRQVHRLRDAGATEFLAAPFGTPDEQRRTLRVLAGGRSGGEPSGRTG